MGKGQDGMGWSVGPASSTDKEASSRGTGAQAMLVRPGRTLHSEGPGSGEESKEKERENPD